MINIFKKSNKTESDKNETVAVIQARMESTRFPGKMLSMLAGKTALERVVGRARLSSVDSIIVATATTKENKKIEKLCDDIGVNCYAGNMDDVLQRVLDAVSKKPNNTILVDITGDCPLVDPVHINWCIERVKKGYDYASNVRRRTWPDGFDIQAYTKGTLQYISGIIIDPKHRSHVGWNVVNYHKLAAYPIKLTNLPAPSQYTLPKLGVTLDTEEDRQLIEKIFEHFDGKGSAGFTAGDVIEFLFEHPELLQINLKVKRKIPGEG